MALTKSWKTTIIIYSLSFGVVLSSIFLGIDVNETQFNFILGFLGISTAAGTSNAIFKNRAELKTIIQQAIDENKKE